MNLLEGFDNNFLLFLSIGFALGLLLVTQGLVGTLIVIGITALVVMNRGRISEWILKK